MMRRKPRGLPALLIPFCAASFLFASCAVLTSTVMVSGSSGELVRDMGVGINIGNTLDAFIDGGNKSPETCWGNPVITKAYVAALAEHGFRSVRLPVTWAHFIGDGPEYAIDDTRMERVREVLQWCRDEGMYAIVNLHHDGGYGDDPWILKANTDFDGTLAKYKAVWKHIAQSLKDMDEGVIFESMNEVGFNDVGKSEAFIRLNAFNQAFVDVVRATGGINSSARHLLIAGYWTDIDESCDSRYKMPTDPAGRTILSVHYYTPSDFTIADKNSTWGYRETWGTEKDYDLLDSQFMKLYNGFISKGVPVIVGEFGVSVTDKDAASRAKWIEAVAKTALSYGACPVFWDTGNDISRYSPYGFKYSGVKSAFEAVFE